MAQLIAFFGMPHIPGFQFWATRGQNGAAVVTPLRGPPGFNGVSQGYDGFFFNFVTCIANTGGPPGAIVGALVELTIATTTVVTFEFTETGVVAPGNVAVLVVNGDTAAACALALTGAINTWFLANMPAAGAASVDPFGTTADVTISALEPSVPLRVTTSGPPVLLVTNNAGKVYGDALLHRAWRAMVYQGVDPAAVSVFPVPLEPGEPYPDIALAFWPLHPYARKAFPKYIIAPEANEKPRGPG